MNDNPPDPSSLIGGVIAGYHLSGSTLLLFFAGGKGGSLEIDPPSYDVARRASRIVAVDGDQVTIETKDGSEIVVTAPSYEVSW